MKEITFEVKAVDNGYILKAYYGGPNSQIYIHRVYIAEYFSAMTEAMVLLTSAAMEKTEDV